MKVLLVEDLPLAAKIARYMLKQLSCDVETACTGKEALSMGLSNHYDLIFMDIGLPDLDGMTVTQQLREGGCKAHVYALTAHSDEGYKIEAHHAGMNGFLIKPLEDEIVRKVVARARAAMPVVQEAQ